jgi:hypothetical protein
MEINHNINFVALVPKVIFDKILEEASPLEVAIAEILTEIHPRINFMNIECVIYENAYGGKTFQNWFRKEYVFEKAEKIAEKRGIVTKIVDNTFAAIAIAERNIKQKIERLEASGEVFTHMIDY